jgi:flagellar hook-length control protein FliK
MFYTFLPVLWDDLRDGEFLFRKNREGGRESYTCDINLDIESLGKLSISVTILDKSFYITFFTERNEVKDLIQLQKHILESRFASQGLSLKAINFNYKKDIPFGKASEQGVDVKI